MSVKYNPVPPRAWSRVQNKCVYPPNTEDGKFAQAQYEQQMRLKGNILQYKKNSSGLTKNQRYAKIAKGTWVNRTKTWATQSDTYSNPNTTSLLRVNFVTISSTNNAFSKRSDPFNCKNLETKDGGSLICNTTVNPCTGEIIQKTISQNICNPSTDSDVPGAMTLLCWNDGTPTWYPRETRVMSTSGNKWPTNYKALVSAISGDPCTFIEPSVSMMSVTPSLRPESTLETLRLDDTLENDIVNTYVSSSLPSVPVQLASSSSVTMPSLRNTTISAFTTLTDNMSCSIYYNPTPTRVWSRVQNPCVYEEDGSDFKNAELTQMLLKGNVLQYKKNSSSLTKQQRYAQISKGLWTNRTKSWATQSETYTNPNTSSLQRVNYETIPLPKPIVNEYGCIVSTFKDGGNLLCNTVVNPCTGVVTKKTECAYFNSTSASNVPGPEKLLYWDESTPTWYPKQRVTMSTSTIQWNYKGLLSAFRTSSSPPCPPGCIKEPTFESFCAFFEKYLNGNDSIKEINRYLETFVSTRGDISLPFDTFNDLNMDMVKIKQKLPAATCLSGMLSTYSNALDMLREYIINNNYVDGLTGLYERYKSDSEILNDTSKLQEYLNKLRKQLNNILDDIVVTSVEMPTIKPMYQKYHDLYGIPDNMEYDPKKLLDIKNSL